MRRRRIRLVTSADRVWTGKEELRDRRAGVGHLLEVIEDQHQPLVLKMTDKFLGHRAHAGIPNAHRPADRWQYQSRVRDRSQADEAHALGKVFEESSANSDREVRLPDPARPGQGDEPAALPDSGGHGRDFVITSEDRGQRRRKIGRTGDWREAWRPGHSAIQMRFAHSTWVTKCARLIKGSSVSLSDRLARGVSIRNGSAHLRYSDGMERMEHQREKLAVEEAVRRILLGCSVLPERAVPLRDARELVLARDVVAGSPSPRFDTAAMDGYAVQHADIRGATLERPVHLGIVGAGVAGDREVTPVAPGTAVRIMTGAVCPEDADVVIPFELVESRGDQIVVSQFFAAGTNIRRTGEDIAVGSVVVERGTVFGPAHLAVIAAEGHETIEVVPRPRVAVIATGDELVRPGQALEPGQIWDSNSVMVAALVEQFGGEVVMSGCAPDEPAAVLAALRREAAEGADLIVTIGGASLGDRDVLTELASDVIALECWSIAMKPGKPLVYGLLDSAIVIGLPGNPAAAFVSAVQFVRPAIVTMLGQLDIDPPTIVARTLEVDPESGRPAELLAGDARARRSRIQREAGRSAKRGQPRHVVPRRTVC